MADPDTDSPTETPAWMLALEKKRERVHRLAHEVGAGSPCLLCKDDCPGLDLHFWRKLCRSCKCKKEDHDVVDENRYEQFDILLGCGQSKIRPRKAFLELLEKQTSSSLAGKANRVAFDWVPPDAPPDLAAEYMQALPSSKLPISGSDGALYRRQQLERQLPLHDLDANQCHQLTESEVDNLKKYLENLRNNVVGQGRIAKLSVPTSQSADCLQNLRTFNTTPKPFQVGAGHDKNNTSLSKLSDESGIAGVTEAVKNLKPPSAFWPKGRLSPDSHGANDSSQVAYSSVAERGAVFGVTLSPSSRRAKHSHGSPHGLFDSKARELPVSLHSAELSEVNKQGEESKRQSSPVNSEVIRKHTPGQIAKSSSVLGNMWVPAECPQCCRKDVNGVLVQDQICSCVSNSSPLPVEMVAGSLPILPAKHNASSAASSAVEINKLGSIGEAHSYTQDLLNPSHTSDIMKTGNAHSSFIPVGTASSIATAELHASDVHPSYAGPLSNSQKPEEKTMLDAYANCPNENVHPMPFDSDGSACPQMLNPHGSKQFSTQPLNLVSDERKVQEAGGFIQRNPCAPGTISSVGVPHVMAMYAHNAINSPCLDPLEKISPQVALASEGGSGVSLIPMVAEQTGSGRSPQETNSDLLLQTDLNCAHCQKEIFPGEVVVCADRAGSEVVWHPSCFVCNTCQELLVDLVYFYSKGRVYCGRHFAELLDIPRCSACDELIFVKEYTVAEGQAFHVKHFCCFECDEPLGGKQYVAKGNQPVCLPCYEQKYGKTCETCHCVIGAKDKGVTWKELHWHATPDCFRCNNCNKSLLGGRFAVKEKRPFCSKECMQSGSVL